MNKRYKKHTSAERFTGEYATDGKARRLQARVDAGHRCIRCGHPFETGKHGKGEWSPCDEKCTHKGPIRQLIPRQRPEQDFWMEIVSNATAGELEATGEEIQAQWRILTVHHFDGNKANDAWWNCMSLCQRCHLTIQSRVDPRIPYFFEHSEWAKPYIAGFYAHHYFLLQLSKKEVMSQLDFLANIEIEISHGTTATVLREQYQKRLRSSAVGS